MSWVNLDDVYVNKTGDTIAGDLSVGGTLTINDGKGTDTTYNVANEITTLRDSVSQSGDWTVFNLGTGYALATRKVDKTISATAQYGYLYFCEYRFNAPDIYDSILYADVKPVTGNGLWFGHYREINNTSTIVCYFSSATSMSKVGMCVQETVIGKLKQYSVSQHTTKRFMYTAKSLKYGAVADFDTNVEYDVYTPVCITTVKSNHAEQINF